MRPAWRGIAGWLLFALALLVAVTTPYPHTGQALAALMLGSLGALLVVAQIRRADQ